MHNKIVTLTLNPVIDKNVTVAGISPNTKLRCSSPTYYAGGGGINVSRAIKKLGGDSLCAYLAGGPTGEHLRQLLNEVGIDQLVVPIKGWTRDNLAVTDTITKLQYRFGVPGPKVDKEEWETLLDQLEKKLEDGDYLVASGKLPPGMPNDFYVQVAEMADRKKVRFVLDTSGEALINAVKSKIFLLKPNLGELGTLCGVNSISAMELEPLAKKFLEEHDCEILVVSLGAKGALLATKHLIQHIPAPTVLQKSTIGAGDSMVAGMLTSLLGGRTFSEMAKYGVACGTAATMHEGTQLCNREDADNLYQWILRQ
ncbi:MULTISPECIES: 1-phosphofructokinase family hexose kinase [unclassified Arenibacter]|uniref:1-phosphofructokinase family hexose kinase n=1 Tax=unclassified Arenibacter TaxID=2615047 RepID=UPI000E354A76|nr:MULTISPECIES: 1-phosphofructokinase family hexose kinase [unclassified Arenibacter]MCM4163396.1 phosphofructokinase [Arenibacter sp. A80]RFT57397.1 1-phosphofructokinase family hexose kinase [Arenibacter sp. P308M17]